MKKASAILRFLADIILLLQPVFAAPLFFTVLMDAPPLWVGLILGVFPLAVRYGLNRNFFKQTPFDIPILILIIGLIVGYLVAENKNTASSALITTLASVLIYYGITSNHRRGKSYWSVFTSIIFLIFISIAGWFFSQGTGRVFVFNEWIFRLFGAIPNTTGPNLHQHGLGILFGVSVPVILGAWLYARQKVPFILLGCLFLLSTTILVFAASGGGWLAALAGVYGILIAWKTRAVYYLIPFTGILTGMALVFYDKLAWISKSLSIGSIISRFDLWVKTIPLISGQHGFLGFGLGNWSEVFDSHYPFYPTHLHNDFLQLYADMGIFGLMAILAGVVVLVTTGKKILSSPNNMVKGIGIGLMGSIIAGAVFSLFDVALYGYYIKNDVYLYISIPLFWICIAAYTVVYKNIKTVQPPEL